MNIVVCTRKQLLARCVERGYTMEEVKDCILKTDGGQIHVDVDHLDYPKKAKVRKVEAKVLPAGPGTELKKLLKMFGLPDRPGCKCNKRAKKMDAWGAEECSKPERITEIVGWLKEEAVKQKVPFVEWAARVIVKRAIRNARKAK